ncbi:MAG TPA: hypothetical protein VN825_03695, partial [Candidatus Acidoferrum sp.]|nr:hypothetical protein [Candidatus Acidoferrum sp.]
MVTKTKITIRTTRCSFLESSKILSRRFISLWRACHTLRVMLSKALQRNPKHEARLSNISGFR